MKLNQVSVRAKLAGLVVLALVLLAGTRGAGLYQLGGYLDRINSHTVTLDAAHRQLQTVQEAHIVALRAGRADAAAQETFDAKVRELRGSIEVKRGEAQALQARERGIMYGTYVSMLVLVFVVCGGIYWLLMRTVVRPLQGVVGVAHRVAAGDLTGDILVKGNDEIGHVMQALRDMNDSLGVLIGKIHAISRSLDEGTEQISGLSHGLSLHVERQAEFLQKTATTLRELTSAVVRNAEQAGQARELAASAREVAIQGGEEVGRAVDTMSRVSASSEKIVDIVSIINGLTFQTNILALNAAVEAARAGEQGRGFAVVAAEVRGLAQRSASAAKEIADLINTSVQELRRGSGLIEKAGATMSKIVRGARAVDDIMKQMAEASADQRQVIEQVRATVDEVDQSTQQQVLLSRAAHAAQAMREQTQALLAAVQVFRLQTHVTRLQKI